jgi:hypothetical protein
MNNVSASQYAVVREHRAVNRASALAHRAVSDYFVQRDKVINENPRKCSVNLFCNVAGRHINVYEVNVEEGEIIAIIGKDADVQDCIVYAPVEQVAFVIEKFRSKQLPREIKGFSKSNSAEQKK